MLQEWYSKAAGTLDAAAGSFLKDVLFDAGSDVGHQRVADAPNPRSTAQEGPKTVDKRSGNGAQNNAKTQAVNSNAKRTATTIEPH